MKADALSPRQLFDGYVHYEVPAFQRPYVWDEERQWAPLWDDILRVAESLLEGVDDDNLAPHHFLGAVVYESKQHTVGDVARHHVIDGQQRTTTLQILLDAVQQVFAERGHTVMADDLERLILNKASAFKGTPERFKLWPSKVDRPAYSQAMDPQPGWIGEHRIIAAHDFFRTEAETWLAGKADADGNEPAGSEEQRVAALSETLQNRLYVVAINLTGHDDAQLIFETLNDRGTPLLKADLIKNWVFQHGERIGANVEAWPETYWADLDDDWWRTEIAQGRHPRSRVDIFMQYWLTMRMKDEVKTEHVFRDFTSYAGPLATDAAATEALLAQLRNDADTYRNFAELKDDTAEGRFHSRVIETMELAATTPLLLWMLSDNRGVPPEQVRAGLGALESWVIRRTLLRRTMKDVNKMMVAILKMLSDVDVSRSGEAVRDFLAGQTADARIWPTDDTMRNELPSIRLYGNVRQGRLRAVLAAVEQRLRTVKHEAVALPPRLEIEHVLPRGWRHHWGDLPEKAAAERDKRINTLGNLTLVTKNLNVALSNRPWTDAEASDLKTGGDPGLGKRSLLDKYSLLVLSKQLIQRHPTAWSDEDVVKRSAEITDHICAIWPAPPPTPSPADPVTEAIQSLESTSPMESVPWSASDLAQLASSSPDMTLRLLDYVAAQRPAELLTGADFTDLGFTSHQVAGVTGALARKVYRQYDRSNPPVEFVQANGRWHYRMSADVAATWCSVRELPQPGSA